MAKLNSFMYIEAINRALGEIRETQHHIHGAYEKGYLTEDRFRDLDSRYDECGLMLEGLHQSLSKWKGTTRTGKVVREEHPAYGGDITQRDWPEARLSTQKAEESYPWTP